MLLLSLGGVVACIVLPIRPIVRIIMRRMLAVWAIVGRGPVGIMCHPVLPSINMILFISRIWDKLNPGPGTNNNNSNIIISNGNSNSNRMMTYNRLPRIPKTTPISQQTSNPSTTK